MTQETLLLDDASEIPAGEAEKQVKRALIVLNPVAGNSLARHAVEAMANCFAEDRDWTYELYETTGKEDLALIVRNRLAQGLDLVLAAGGDGTISGVVDALVYQKVPLAIVPLGTGNVLARELKIPLKLEEACDLLLKKPRLVELDIMQVNGRAFISHISMGVYSLIIQKTNPDQKRRLGRLAYIWAAFQRLLAHKTWRFTLTIDDQTRRFRASSILVANAGAVGVSSLRWGADICLDDGQLNICIIRGRTILDYLKLAWSAFRNQHHRNRQLVYLTGKRSITIKTNGKLPVRADGEIIGEGIVHIQVLPRALQVIAREEAVDV
jgi:diacylglycerol kinase (ATP)